MVISKIQYNSALNGPKRHLWRKISAKYLKDKFLGTKERAQVFLKKNLPWQLGKCTVRRTPLWQHLWFYIKQGVASVMKNFGINCQLWNKLFLIVIHRFSLVKAAMQAPCICELRNGVKKTAQFLILSIAKGRTKTIAHLSIAER
jgi:hypothetical protein